LLFIMASGLLTQAGLGLKGVGIPFFLIYESTGKAEIVSEIKDTQAHTLLIVRAVV